MGILFFWSWFNLLSPEFTAIHKAAISVVWIIFDAAHPILAGALGIHLLRGGNR